MGHSQQLPANMCVCCQDCDVVVWSWVVWDMVTMEAIRGLGASTILHLEVGTMNNIVCKCIRMCVGLLYYSFARVEVGKR